MLCGRLAVSPGLSSPPSLTNSRAPDRLPGTHAQDSSTALAVPAAPASRPSQQSFASSCDNCCATSSTDSLTGAACVLLLFSCARETIQAVERVVPNARKMAKTVLIGSPLTHERFNRRR